jgi:hypothetical protein
MCGFASLLNDIMDGTSYEKLGEMLGEFFM